MKHYFTAEILKELKYRAVGRQMAIEALLSFSENDFDKLFNSEQKEKEVFNSIIYLIESISVSNEGNLDLESIISDIKAIYFD